MEERKLTDKEERIAQSLPDKEFKKRYGKDWKSVKIATATKMAKMKESIRNFIKTEIKNLTEKNNDEPSDAEYDQMAKDAEQDDLMRKAAELGYLDLEEIGPYKGGNLLPGAEDIDFDVKSINMVYTDFGRFYGFNMYSEPGLKGQREKFSFRADVDDFLKSKGIKTEIPVGYDTDILDSIVADLRKQGIEAEHNDYMDVSEGNLKEIASELGYLNEITVSGGQEAARNYPPTENPGDMFAQKEVEDLLPASFASRNQELKARMQGHANWAKQDRFNNTFVHFQANTVTDGNNIYRIGMSQHYNGNYTGFKNPRFTEIRVKELDNESDMEKDLGKYVVDTTALMQDLRKLKTIERVS